MSPLTEMYDVLIIGGGSAGLMAAAVASEQGKRVLLIEKNAAVGKKLSITGGGRCNILNAEADTRSLLSHYGEAAKFLHSPFAQFGMQHAWDFFTSRGLPLVVETGKRAFPASHQAADVVAFFMKRLQTTGVTICTSTPAQSIAYEGDAVTGIMTSRGLLRAKAYIIATGGLSHPDTGSTGEGLVWLGSLGHSIVRPDPSLVPLIVSDPWVHSLAGVTLPDAKITFVSVHPGANHKLCVATGKVLFTHFGLSGPAILNSAAEVQTLLKKGAVRATLDVVPQHPIDALNREVTAVFAAHQNKVLKNVVKYFVPPGMSSAVVQQLPASLAETPVHSITREARRNLVALVKALQCTVTGTKGNDWAIVSDGGVPLTEVDTRTMRSRRYDNLYIVGDALHISRPSGGYSLQLCWTTGAVAASAA